MNLVGDLTVFTISIAMVVMFWWATRQLGRAGRGANQLLAGLIVLMLGATVDSAEHVPGGTALLQRLLGPASEGTAYGLYALAFLIIGSGLFRWLPLVRRIDQESAAREYAEAELQAALERARQFNTGLEALARLHIEESWDLSRLVDEAVRRVSQLAGTARVSVWRLSDDGGVLECVTLFDERTGVHERGVRLERSVNPSYFDAIAQGRVINVACAEQDPATSAFTDIYLRPTGVGALLDAPILAGRRVRGVVCCEHVGGERQWTPEEVSLVSATAQYIAVADLADDSEILAGELHRALKAAEAASEAKSTFLANMSHELRTPLNGVLGMADALAHEGLAPAQAEKAQIIVRSGRHLLGVLNDILDLSRIEAGRLRLASEPLDPTTLISDVCSLFEASATQKGLLISCDTSGLPAHVAADPVRLRQVVSNLVANAVKFTETGGVQVRARAYEDFGAGWRLEIAVSDTGCGISEVDQARLFRRFSQADGSAARRHGGTGLGLVIARELAQAMGGDVALRSTLGEGTCFTVSVRAGKADPWVPGDHATIAGRLKGARILLVDDNEINRLVARCFLEPAGAIITEAESGADAIEAFTQAPFDLVLLDVHMPGLGGVETLHRLRALAGGSAPAIALTADALPGDAERYRAAGMDGYVAKPVDRETLIAACAVQLAAHDGAKSEPGTMASGEADGRADTRRA
jgi:signal transduction histidine kinase/CheY-like chemotaxis protein